MASFCLLTISIVFFLLKKAGIMYADSGTRILLKPLTILAFIIFSLLVGLRYNPDIDLDFMNYWWVAQYGDNFYEYDRFELIPRSLADLVHYFHWPPSSWFIMMGALLIGFTCYAAIRIKNSFLCYAYLGLVLLYLKFDMNVMRQGVALSVFLCACTYISKKDWRRYLIFSAIAFCFHKISIIWTPVFALTFLDWNKNFNTKIFLIFIGMVLAEVFLIYLLQRFSFILMLLGKESMLEGGNIDMMERESKGSGIGVLIRYIRWALLLWYLPKFARLTRDKSLYILYTIFLMGVIMDPFSMYEILTQRVSFYPQIIELLLYPYLLEYARENTQSKSIIYPIMTLQVIFLTYVISGYFAKWQFV